MQHVRLISPDSLYSAHRKCLAAERWSGAADWASSRHEKFVKRGLLGLDNAEEVLPQDSIKAPRASAEPVSGPTTRSVRLPGVELLHSVTQDVNLQPLPRPAHSRNRARTKARADAADDAADAAASAKPQTTAAAARQKKHDDREHAATTNERDDEPERREEEQKRRQTEDEADRSSRSRDRRHARRTTHRIRSRKKQDETRLRHEAKQKAAALHYADYNDDVLDCSLIPPHL
ncbi:unnamed protein product [Boreogadus saida]